MKNLYRLTKCIVLAAIFTLWLCAIGSSQELKVYKVLTANPPTLDGKFMDECWKSAQWETEFVQTITGTGIAPIQTRFASVRDKQAIYFAVECLEPDMGKLLTRITADDGNMWEDDCVEILLDPTGKDTLQHLIINPTGFKYDSDSTAGGAGWNPNWQVKTSIQNDRWTLEVRIPFASLRVKNVENAIWRINICRERQAGKRQLSGWSDPRGDFQNPLGFGFFIFGKYSDQARKTILPEWKQISSQVSLFRNSKLEEDKKLVVEYDKIAGIINPIVDLFSSDTDITGKQFSTLYSISQSSFPQLHELLNAREINKLLEEGTRP